jgi:hypothetical protein
MQSTCFAWYIHRCKEYIAQTHVTSEAGKHCWPPRNWRMQLARVLDSIWTRLKASKACQNALAKRFRSTLEGPTLTLHGLKLMLSTIPSCDSKHLSRMLAKVAWPYSGLRGSRRYVPSHIPAETAHISVCDCRFTSCYRKTATARGRWLAW